MSPTVLPPSNTRVPASVNTLKSSTVAVPPLSLITFLTMVSVGGIAVLVMVQRISVCCIPISTVHGPVPAQLAMRGGSGFWLMQVPRSSVTQTSGRVSNEHGRELSPEHIPIRVTHSMSLVYQPRSVPVPAYSPTARSEESHKPTCSQVSALGQSMSSAHSSPLLEQALHCEELVH